MAENRNNRELTNKERERTERVRILTEALEKQGYVRRDEVIDMTLASVLSVILVVPFMIVFFCAYRCFNGANTSYDLNFIVFVIYFVLIVVHELVHGLMGVVFSKERFHAVEFGFIASALAPYCVCKEPQKKIEYILYLIMPFLVLGLTPCLIAIAVNSFNLLFVGLSMILGAGGDLTILIKLLHYRPSSKDFIILDHPCECGFVIFERCHGYDYHTPKGRGFNRI